MTNPAPAYKTMAESAIVRLAGLLETGVLEGVYKTPVRTASAVLTIVSKMETEALRRGERIELPNSIQAIKKMMAPHDQMLGA